MRDNDIIVTADKDYLYIDLRVPRAKLGAWFAKEHWYGDVIERLLTCIEQLQAGGSQTQQSPQAPKDAA